MKYFTPELIVAYGSDDSVIWKDAEARWQTLGEQYRAYLASIKAELPPGLRRIEDNHFLHDAVIRAMGRRDGTFVIVLQLDTPPRSLLTLAYALAEEPNIQKEVLPPEYRSTSNDVEWQYDEIEKVAGQPPTWRQSILLSNGWEIGLHFRDVLVEEIQALLPAPSNGAPALSMASLSQAI
jgi:hypothetical protein